MLDNRPHIDVISMGLWTFALFLVVLYVLFGDRPELLGVIAQAVR